MKSYNIFKIVSQNFCILKYKAILLICMCSFLITTIASANDMYYEDKNLQGYIDSINEIKAPLDPHTEKIIVIQMTFMLDAYPEIYKELLNNINNVPEHLRPAIIQGIVNVKGKDIETNKNYKLLPQQLIAEINSFRYRLPSDNEENMVINTDSTDYLWAALDATGNKDYVQKIITFLSQIPLKSRVLGEEVKNRANLDKAWFELTGSQGKEVQNLVSQLTLEERYEVATYQIISWSLESSSTNHPKIKVMVDSIFNANPELNFYKAQ